MQCQRKKEIVRKSLFFTSKMSEIKSMNTCRNKEKGTAPIFDTGTSLKFNTETSAIFAESESSLRSKPFKTTHHEQIKLVNSPERFELLNLNGFEEEARNILLEGNVISPLRADQLAAFIKQRINLLNLYFSKR